MPQRPVVAIISNSLPPYRLHFHRRIVREMPEIELASIFTHGESNSPWAAQPPADIKPVQFGADEPSASQSSPRFAVREWRKGGRIIRWLRNHAVRAVVIGGYNDAGRLRIIRWCRRQRLPCFLFGDSNIRGDLAVGMRRRIKRLLVPRALAACTGVLPCGTLGVEYFANYGVPREKMFLCPYEPDYDETEQISAPEIAAVCDRFNLSPDRRRLVYCGRLAAVKRVDLAIDAFAALSAERPEWDFLIVGDGPMAAELRRRVPKAIVDRVHFLGFIDDQRTIATINRACDILVLPSDYEPWAVVVNEALAAGMGVVATDAVGAAADLVKDGVNGRIVPHNDLGALVEGLRDATAHCEEYRTASAGVLSHWRSIADPVEGIRKALRSVGLIAAS